MKHLFLTSSIGVPGVAESIRQKIGHNDPLKTVFITTPLEPASEQEDMSWVDEDRLGLVNGNFVAFDYTITGKNIDQIRVDLKDIDVLYVSGGNTNYLLEQSEKSGFTEFVRDHVASGKLYISTSAGSIIAGPTIPPYLWGDETSAPNLSDYSGYNLVNFTVVPHWGSSWFKELYLKGRMSQIFSESYPPFIMCNDYQYVQVIDDQYRIIDVRHEK